MLLQLLGGDERLAAFHAANLILLRSRRMTQQLCALASLVAPATGRFLVLLEVPAASERGQASHALDGLWLALVLVIEAGQPEVGLAVCARVRQQAQVREAVAQQQILLAEALAAVGAQEGTLAGMLLHVAPQALRRREALVALGTMRLAGLVLVLLHVHPALCQAREDALAVVALVELRLEVRGLQVEVEALLRLEAGLTHATADGHGLGMGAQVGAVVGQVAELLVALGAAVGTHARVLVHVFPEEEAVDESLMAHTAMVLSRRVYNQNNVIVIM